MMSSSELLTMRPRRLSQSAGTVTRARYPGSLEKYASLRNAQPLMGSGSAAVKRQPRSSRIGSTTVMPIARSRPLSLRTMIARHAQGQASET
jgi:hypothetical protein